MDGASILAVSTAVVALTQIVKWQGMPDKWGPVSVLFLALIGIAFWAYSKGTFERTLAFDYFAAWIVVATSAAGVFGFTRAASTAVTSATSPPAGGAGMSTTLKT